MTQTPSIQGTRYEAQTKADLEQAVSSMTREFNLWDLSSELTEHWRHFPTITPAIRQYLSRLPCPAQAEDLVALIAIDMEFRYQFNFGEQGQSKPPLILHVEDYLSLIDLHGPDLALRLIDEEGYWRKRYGDLVVVSEYARRFPELCLTSIQNVLEPYSGQPGPLIDDCDWECRLDEGGMGVVHLYWHRAYKKRIALKIAKNEDGALKSALVSEATKLLELSHPNLVKIFEFYPNAIHPFYTMEYIEGRRFPCDNFCEGSLDAFAQLVEVLQYLHSRRIFHCDIKPNNLMVDQNGRVVLLDLGVSVQANTDNVCDPTVPMLCGSIPFLPPERLQQKAFTAASDWYSLGILLFKSLTGKLPFSARSIEESLQEKQNPPRPRAFSADIPQYLDELCSRLLCPVPSERPTADELLAVLRPQAKKLRQEKCWIGRQDALDTLRRAFHDSREDRSLRGPVIVTVSGESGIGKTSTVERFLSDVERCKSTIVLRGKCYASGVIGSYDAFNALLRALVHKMIERWGSDPQRLRSYLPPDIAALSALDSTSRTEELLRLANLNSVDKTCLPTDPTAMRIQAHAAFRDVLRMLSRDFRLVLFVDDLQWAGADSAELMRNVFLKEQSPNCLLIMGYRSAEPSIPCLTTLQQSGMRPEALRNIELLPHCTNEMRLFFQSQFVSSNSGESILESLVECAQGNPLRAELIAKQISLLVGKEIPSTANLIDLQLSQLDRPQSGIIETLALCARPLSIGMLTRLCELGLERDCIIRWLGSQALVKWTTDGRIELFHDSIREASMAKLSSNESALRSLSRKLALRLIEENDCLHYDLAAELLEKAGETNCAAEFHQRAAETAAETMKFEKAAEHQRRSIELAKCQGAELGLQLTKEAEYLASAGKLYASASQYLVAANCLTADAKLDAECQAALRFLTGGYVEPGLAALKAVFQSNRLQFPTVLSSKFALYWQIPAVSITRRSLKPRACVTKRNQRILNALWAAVSGLSVVDPLIASSIRLRYLGRAFRAGDSVHAIRSLVTYVGFVGARGGRCAEPKLDQLLDEVRTLATTHSAEIGEFYAQGVSHLATGIAAHLQSKWEIASAECEMASRILEGVRDATWEVNTAQSFSMWALLYQGKVSCLFELQPNRYALAAARKDLFAQLNFGSRISAWMKMAIDEIDVAQQTLAEDSEMLPKDGFFIQHHNCLLAQSQLHLYNGCVAQAWKMMQSAWPSYSRCNLHHIEQVRLDFWTSFTQTALAQYAASGQPALLRQLQHGLRKLRRESNPWAQAHLQAMTGGLLALDGKKHEACQCFDQAQLSFQSLSMELHSLTSAFCRRLLRQEQPVSEEQAIHQLGFCDPRKAMRTLIPIDKLYR
jgi:eukaryotic-like serine/threonine-protein kinase